jgi:serine protease AprX
LFRRIKLIILLLCFGHGLRADSTTYYFWVEFKDKAESIALLTQPESFLSKQSILRKYAAGIPITYTDLPVSNAYLRQLQSSGYLVQFGSRWLNAALVKTLDSSACYKLRDFPFVKSAISLGYKENPAPPDYDTEVSGIAEKISIPVKSEATETSTYGAAYEQITQLKVDELHRRGYDGRGIRIAILDAGFYKANQMQLFDSLFQQGRVLFAHDFVDHENNVYNDDDHGMQVLSCLASDIDGVMRGSAPGADYLLLRSEDASIEMPFEEALWVQAAEFADRIGVDVISSSLGYTTFDDEKYDHRLSDLDGETTIISRAAEAAASKGILVVTSAGNEGDVSWGKIAVPADAEHVIAVAAVDKAGEIAGFSSRGPTFDGRIKPDVAAMGKRTAVASASGYIVKSNGTSYSAPLLAGAMASAMQATGYNAMQMRNALLRSKSPDTLVGHGIPDFSDSVWMPAKRNPKSHEVQDPGFIHWVPSDTVRHAFVVATQFAPEKQWRYKLSCDCGKVWSQEPMTEIRKNWYGTLIVPEKTGLHFLEVTDGKSKFKESFYFIEP